MLGREELQEEPGQRRELPREREEKFPEQQLGDMLAEAEFSGQRAESEFNATVWTPRYKPWQTWVCPWPAASCSLLTTLWREDSLGYCLSCIHHIFTYLIVL